MNKQNIIFIVVYLLFLAAIGSQIQEIPRLTYETVSSRVYPLVIVGVGALFGIVELGRIMFLSRKMSGAPSLTEVWKEALSPKRMITFCALLAYAVLIPYLGFLTATAVFLLGLVSVLSPRISIKSFVVSLMITALMLVIIYTTIVVLLQSFLP